MQHETRDGMHQERLPETRTRTRASRAPERRLHVDEGQRNELGEAARAPLQLADPHQMSRPVLETVDVAEHDGRRAPQAYAVRGLHDLEPLGGAQLVGTEYVAYLVIQDLGRRAGQGRETLRLEPLQERLERKTQRTCAMT